MKKQNIFSSTLKLKLFLAALLVITINANAQLSIWRFDDNANASPATYNATLVGSPGYAAGRVNNALSLNGTTQYATTPFVFNPVSSDFTVTAWVRYTGTISAGVPAASPAIVQQLDASGTGRGLLWLNSNNAAAVTAGTNLRFGTSLGNSATYGTTTVAANTWYMVSVTKVGTTIKIYVNGAWETTSTRTSETTIGGLRIGTTKTGTLNTFWNGQIDEVAIYTTALSDADLLALYKSSHYFRSTTSGNWATIGTWESSADNTTFAAATAAPTSSAAAVNVQAGHEVTVAATASASTLTVDAGGKLTLNSGNSLSATNFNLKSSATNGTATFKDLGGTLTVTNPPTVEQYLTAGRNWYISSPVDAATSNVFAADATNPLYYYVETAPNDWTSKIENTSTPLTKGKGYVAKINSTRVVTFTGGNLNTGTQSITGLTSGGASFTGYNLVGNPYPSYVKWDNASRTSVSSSIWYRSKSTVDPYPYQFQTYNVSGAGMGTNGGTNLIPPMQAFWVKVISGTGSIGFVNADRDHLDQSVLANRLKAPAEDTRKILRLEVSNAANKDETVIYADANAQNGFDTYDSNKMFANDAAVPEIYTVLEAEKLAINGFNDIADNQQLALGFKTSVTESSSFSIKANEVKNFAAGTKIILKDNTRLGEEFDITDGTAYNYTSGATNDASRFSILFRAPGAATGVNTVEKLNAQVFVNAANQITIVAPVNSKYFIYNAMGQFIEGGVATSNFHPSADGQNFKHAAGVYVVRVSDNGKELTTRVVIK